MEYDLTKAEENLQIEELECKVCVAQSSNKSF